MGKLKTVVYVLRVVVLTAIAIPALIIAGIFVQALVDKE